ncbi:hypothetical protein CEY16_13490 [Halalkalibacillus sediminis]|uniref:Uncharacterized protein n=1 Tax=Halalkalibacillus sediminis TaxID=2018042 RepID=A0A2I0QR64_9BACI|nr:tetratricopeptide repeat protein [Halalkalibacillus sediminis]PKR76824.1 hypothetical protein CEY16_13490 [Halalkalibacillus sediminis]
MSTISNLNVLIEKIKKASESIYFDPKDSLREKPSDPELLKNIMEEIKFTILEENLTEDNQNYLHGVLGNFYRIIGEPKEAIRYHKQCLSYAKETHNERKEIVSSIRLGEALKYADQPLQAMNHFNQTFDLCKKYGVDEYKDFVLQHKGKCLLEMEEYEEAERCFKRVLEIRKEKNDPSLIQSTEAAVDFVFELRER